MAEIKEKAARRNSLKPIAPPPPPPPNAAPKAMNPQDALMAEIKKKAADRNALKPTARSPAKPELKREKSFATVLREKMQARLKSMNKDSSDEDDDDEWKD